MRRHRISVGFVLVVLAAFLDAAVAAAQGIGAVVGHVQDSAGNLLVGAEVALVGGGLKTSTGAEGRFRLSGVPAGKHTVQVSYLSAAEASQEITVEDGQTVELEIRLQRFGEEIEVRATPLLAGQASALNQQKNAVNITNVVAADQIGRFPDPNAAEAIQRIPAITLQRDQGEGRYIIVRGTEARLNSTTVDGERIPSPEADTRDIALDVIPADLLQAIEVSKALTPDMDGDAIGGSVNLVTKRAPEVRRISATLAAGHNEIVDDGISNANFTAGGRTGEGSRLGVLVAGSYYDTNRGSQNFESEYDDGDLDTLELRNYVLTRERYGLNTSLDFAKSERATLFARYLWNEYRDDEIRRAAAYVVGDDAIERAVRDRLQQSKITSFTVGAEWLLDASNSLDVRAAFNRSREETPNQLTSVFVQEDVEFDPNVSPDGIDPDNIQANPQNEDVAEFFLDSFETNPKEAEEEDLVAAVDFAHAFYRDADLSGRLKLGAKARFKEKIQDNGVTEFEPEDDLALASVLSGFRPATSFLGGRYDIGPFPDPDGLRRLFGQLDLESEDDLEEELADFTANEDTLAAYGMAELEIGASSTLVAGLRVESTESEYDAFELEVDEEGDPVALRPVNGGNDYTELLPMVHFKYRLDEHTNLRAAVTRTLARPNFIDQAPYQLILREDEEIERGNPDLDVTTAWNVDLFAERYFEPLGLISGGVFYKRLSDNIFTFRFEEPFDGDDFDVTQKRNGDEATVMGAEFAYQNSFANGFGVFLNLTFADSEASYPDRDEERLQGQAEQVGNLALSYERGRVSGRVSFNYHGEYPFEIGEEAAEDLWVDEHFQIDFAATVRLNERFSLSLQLNNLDDEPFRVYEGSPDRPVQEEYYGWWGTVGLKFDL